MSQDPQFAVALIGKLIPLTDQMLEAHPDASRQVGMRLKHRLIVIRAESGGAAQDEAANNFKGEYPEYELLSCIVEPTEEIEQ